MTKAEQIWQNKSDEEVLRAAASLEEYTEEGKQVIRREAERRGLDVGRLADVTESMHSSLESASRSRCAYCGTRILFLGTTHGDFRFCNEHCRTRGVLIAISHQVPDAKVNEAVWRLHQGSCPECGEPGPVDVEKSYRVWSAGVLTRWTTRPRIACRRCGTTARIKDGLFSLTLGWWALPWGFIITPVQVARNLLESFGTRDRSKPSPQLEKLVRVQMASGLVTTNPTEEPDDRSLRHSAPR